ncbi:MAG TPA: hypothetical protein ENG87_01975 [Candidatus Pacearchaeota archaeon]|nr:hypothetical protein BMS3Abin17_00469 [archaeon BMS3Abin17]HDK42121.1 hypothetical protein [Candidatus Pacearchaeota archaeon]HDZ60776.1 hypothetical protein [Candidatus Pacearchaeota archaeon]
MELTLENILNRTKEIFEENPLLRVNIICSIEDNNCASLLKERLIDSGMMCVTTSMIVYNALFELRAPQRYIDNLDISKKPYSTESAYDQLINLGFEHDSIKDLSSIKNLYEIDLNKIDVVY